jgi:Raf kinase inhibitor-like YbhB/YbcL family protein
VAFTLSSSSFGYGEPIPTVHSCDGAGLSPPLAWADPPHGTNALALIVDDPDAWSPAPFVHWLVVNISPDADGRALGASGNTMPAGAVEGANDGGRVGYFPTCPPHGKHRYEFKLFALRRRPVLRAGFTRRELERAMIGNVLAIAELVGTFAREPAEAIVVPV